MVDSPSENTLTVNITHRQLQSLEPTFSRLVAIAPTRVEEGKHRSSSSDPEGGYDISLQTAKEVVFQHKRPYDMVEHDDTDWLKFDVDTDQCWALAEQYELGQAFLALPVVPTEAELQHSLTLTVFVDAHLVDYFNDPGWMPPDGDSISTVYVEQSPSLVDELRNGTDLADLDRELAPSVYLKSDTSKWKMGGPAYKNISMQGFQSYGIDWAIAWEPLADYIQSCYYGVRIRGGERQSQTIELSDELRQFIPSELPESVEASYRNRIARTRALMACTRGLQNYDMGYEEFVSALSDDITRRRQAEDDLFRLQIDREAVSSRVSEKVEYFWGNPGRFRRVANRTRRHIIEGGSKMHEISIE